MKKTKIIIITCPECKKIGPVTTEYKPFCSKRCKIKDLSKWSDGSYCFVDTQETLTTNNYEE